MDELLDLKSRMEQERPAAWENLPDIALYMDQLISYMPRQLIHFDENEALTSAMVNNYIKDGLVPRADGKRYGPIHLGYLTAVSALKKVLSVPGTVGILLCRRPGPTGETLPRSCMTISAGPWIGLCPTLPAQLTPMPSRRIFPVSPWTWPCAAMPVSWPVPAFWISFSRPSMRPASPAGARSPKFHES